MLNENVSPQARLETIMLLAVAMTENKELGSHLHISQEETIKSVNDEKENKHSVVRVLFFPPTMALSYPHLPHCDSRMKHRRRAWSERRWCGSGTAKLSRPASLCPGRIPTAREERAGGLLPGLARASHHKTRKNK